MKPNLREHPLTIGLLVDEPKASKYVLDLCQWAKNQNDIAITHLIVLENPPPSNQHTKSIPGLSPLKLICNLTRQKGFFQALAIVTFWAICKKEEQSLSSYERYKDHLKPCDLTPWVPNSLKINPLISPSGHVYRFSPEDITRVKSLNFDLLIRCGGGILRGEILKSSKWGILSFHHADNRINRGWPAGFWEIYLGQKATGFTIQILTEQLDGGNVLFRGAIPTKTTYLFNQARLFLTANHYLKQLLRSIALKRSLPEILPSPPYDRNYFSHPGLWHISQYYIRSRLKLLCLECRKKFNLKERWGVAFVKSDWDKAVLPQGIRLKNPKNHFLADPFVISKKDKDFCFVEDLDYQSNRGYISVYEIKDKTAHRLGVALKEPFHLSFPFVFEFNDDLFMCPETSGKKEIRIYKCIDFPLQWKLEKIIMKGINAADSMIFEKGGLWWLLTNIDPLNIGDNTYEMSIFYATAPLSDTWHAHAQNPIIVNPGNGQNGGLLYKDRQYYRVAQCQGMNTYGESFSINKIKSIDPNVYMEEKIGDVLPIFFKNIFATHHMHSNGRITVYDFCERARV